MWILAVVDGAVPADLETVTAAGLTAVVENDAGEADESPLARMLRHADVVGGLLQTADSVVPARGGSRLDGVAEVRAALRDQSRDLHASLDRVRGCVELAVACELAKDDPARNGGDHATDGRAYLADRVHRWRRSDELAQQADGLADLPGVREVRVLSATAGGVTASLLVGSDGWESTQAAVEDSIRDWPGAARCTGPFPPYSFCSRSVVPA